MNIHWLMLKLKLQYFGHLMWRVHSLEKTLFLGNIKDKRRRGQQKMRWLDGIINSMEMSVRKLRESERQREAWWAQVHGVAKNQTQLCDWTTTYPHLERREKALVVVLDSLTAGRLHLLVWDLSSKVDFGEFICVFRKNEIMFSLDKCMLEHLEN